MGKQWGSLMLILVVLGAAIYIVLTRPLALGLDLKGGSQLTLQAQPTAQVPEITPAVMQGLVRVIEQRINGLGVAEPLIQLSGRDQVFVQLAGVADPDRAVQLLGDTAQLEFRRQRIGTQIPPGDIPKEELDRIFEPVGLTGAMLTNALAQPPRQGSQFWEVGLQFTPEGGEIFAELTKSLAGTGRAIGIFLDDRLISAPVVPAQFAATGITGGQAVITGNFDVNAATDLAIKLKAGALPVPVQVIENRTVGATLGAESIRRSLYAGGVGIVLVLLFMVFYYRLPGLLADLALLVYAVCTLACFQLLGVTMSLPGIAGFILSIGMAVDANILIFERMREELQAGKSLYKSIEEGFDRAFGSILDGNVTTLLVCAVLFSLGMGLLKGFAVTLAIGIIISFFSALLCTRTLLRLVVSVPALRNRPHWYRPLP
ncbi:MAG: protein translocase subunit SecD [Thermostichales cyanobacterium DRC_bins_46]